MHSPSVLYLGSGGSHKICICIACHISAPEVSLIASSVDHTWVRLTLEGRDSRDSQDAFVTVYQAILMTVFTS